MRAASWTATGLLVAALFGMGFAAATGASAEVKQYKPGAKRTLAHPRLAPHGPAWQGGATAQQNAGPRNAPRFVGSPMSPTPRFSTVTPYSRFGTAGWPSASRPMPALWAARAPNFAGAQRRAFVFPGALRRQQPFFAGRNGAFGSLANRQRGGNGAPPGMRLIDMRVMPLPPGSGLPSAGETRFRANELVLQFSDAFTPQDIAAIARRFGLSVVAQQAIGALRRSVYTLRIDNGQPVDSVIREIDGAGFDAAAQPNYTYGLAQDRTGVETGDAAQYVVQKLHLEAAHRITEGNDVVVALIDSRVDTRQPDFAGRIVETYDSGCGADAPPDAHGTGMAGAIAAHSGLVGVAPNAKIIAICAFGGNGAPQATSANIIRGLDYAIARGAKIVNMSFAGPADPALAQELQVAREKGILIVAAAGNAGPDSPPLYPGADPNVMAVTATDAHDRLFAGANQGSYVAVAAPGVDVLVPAPAGRVQFSTGTSVATANVSGVAALLVAEQPARSPEDIRSILVSTARHLGTDGVNPQFGAGLVDPLKALRAAPEVVGQVSDHAAPAAEAR